MRRSTKSSGRTIVLKVGSASLTDPNGISLNLPFLATIVSAIVNLKQQGHRVILVTSGAVSTGCIALKMKDRPKDLIVKQAVAAVGQSKLMQNYDELFSLYNQPIAQLLMCRHNFKQNRHHTNSLNTLNQLIDMGILPIVNENDTVAVEELQIGDNDTLSALVASMVEADLLVLLTDVEALYTSDPNQNPNATPIRKVDNIDQTVVDVGGGGKWGTGGMATKIQAARIACAAGVTTIICAAARVEMISKLCTENNFDVGTTFTAASTNAGPQRST